MNNILSNIAAWDHIKLVSRLAAVLVATLALMAFILSYNSLQHMAQTNGIPGRLSYIWPLLLDFAMVVFSLAILRANLRDEKAYYAWGLTIAFAILATVANVLDVTTLNTSPVLIGAAVKALAPLALVLSFELLMSMVKAEVKRAAVLSSLAQLMAKLEAARVQFETEWTNHQEQMDKVKQDFETEQTKRLVELDKLSRQIETQRQKLEDIKTDILRTNRVSVQEMAAAKQARVDTRQQEVLELLSRGRTPKDIADYLEVSERTIKRDIDALSAAGLWPKMTTGGTNGHSEVTL